MKNNIVIIFSHFLFCTSMFIQCVRACLFHHHQSPPVCRTSMCERLCQISFLLVPCWLTRFSFSSVLTLSPPTNIRRKMRTIDKQVLLNRIIHYPCFLLLLLLPSVNEFSLSFSLCVYFSLPFSLFLVCCRFIIDITIVVFRIRKRSGENER